VFATILHELLKVGTRGLKVLESEELWVGDQMTRLAQERFDTVVSCDGHRVTDTVGGPSGDSRGVDSNDAPLIQQRATGVSGIDRGVGLVEVVLLSADDAFAHFEMRHPQRIPERVGLHARGHLRGPGVELAHRFGFVVLHPNQRQIEERAHPHHLRVVLPIPLARNLHAHVLRVLHHVRAGQNVPLFVDEEAGSGRGLGLHALERHAPVEPHVVHFDPHYASIVLREVHSAIEFCLYITLC